MKIYFVQTINDGPFYLLSSAIAHLSILKKIGLDRIRKGQTKPLQKEQVLKALDNTKISLVKVLCNHKLKHWPPATFQYEPHVRQKMVVLFGIGDRPSSLLDVFR